VENITADPFSDLKQEMNANSLPEGCSKCIYEEQNGGVSERIRDILSKDLQELESFKNSKKVKTFELRILVSNVCNLSCRSCDHYSSSTYAKITKNNETDHLQVDITDIDSHWNLILSVLNDKIDNCEFFYLHFMGGEPLLHKGNRKIIDYLVSNNLNHKVFVRITTSINVPIDKEFLEKLDQFKGVDFILSIDGVYENYHYVRWPGKFEKTLSNLNEIVDYKNTSKSQKSFNYILSPVFSLNNIFYIQDYLDFWHRWSKEKNVNLFFLNTNLHFKTRHLDIQALPVKYRAKLKILLQEASKHLILNDYSESMQHLHNFLTSALYELDLWKEDYKLWNQFLIHTAEFDIRTGVTFEKYNKNFYDMLTLDDKDLFSQKLKAVNKTQKIDFTRLNDYSTI
jgi:organic radical activating enzyme